jgi:hypothetical protein
MVDSGDGGAFDEIRKGLEIVDPYLNLFKSQKALGGVFGITAMGNKNHSLKEILGCSPDKFGNPNLLETVTLVSALETMNDAVDNLPQPDLGIFDWRLHYQDEEWKEPSPSLKTLDRYVQVTGHWIHVLEDLLNPEKNSDPKLLESVLTYYSDADSSTIVQTIRGDLEQRQSLPDGLEETLKNLCLERYPQDLDAIKKHMSEGCSKVSRLLLERLDHIEQCLSSEDATVSEAGDKEDMSSLEYQIAQKNKILRGRAGEAVLKYILMVASGQFNGFLGHLGIAGQKNRSQTDLQNVAVSSEEVSRQATGCLELQKQLDQLKTHQAERKHFEREFPKTKEELQQRLKALIYPADQGSSLMSQQYRQSQGR